MERPNLTQYTTQVDLRFNTTEGMQAYYAAQDTYIDHLEKDKEGTDDTIKFWMDRAFKAETMLEHLEDKLEIVNQIILDNEPHDGEIT